MTSSDAVKAVMENLRQQQFYLVSMDLVTPTDDPLSVITPHFDEHFSWLRDREADNSLFLSGACIDDTGWDGSGLAVMRGESRRAVEEMARSEPLCRAGVRRSTVRGWRVNEGNVSLRLKLLDNSFDIY